MSVFSVTYIYGGEGGLYCSFFRNSLVFCPFMGKTRIFCRLMPSLSSLIHLSSALPSLPWTSKVPKKNNMSNKSGFPFLGLLPFLRPQVRQEFSKFSWRSGQNCKPWDPAGACDGGAARRATRVQITASSRAT